MASSSLEAAVPRIRRYFEDAGPSIYRLRDLERVLAANQLEWRLPRRLSFDGFLRLLQEQVSVQRVRLELPHRPETRFVSGKVAPVILALAIKPQSYLTHFSALAVHELTDQVPKTIYVNVEQRPHLSNPDSLTQEGIDRAFRNPQRMTKNFADYQGFRLMYLNGRFTKQLGVIDRALPTGEGIRVTDLERTLIDVAVRPAYAGGVVRVAEAVQQAIQQLSVERLAEYLDRMKFVYPYEQVIGFYLQRAGAPRDFIRYFRREPMKFDFYLAHGLRDMQYVKEWRLHIPKGF